MTEEIIESSKAIQEVAKTTGIAVTSLKELCAFIAKYTAGSLQQACGIFEDKLKYARWENELKLMLKAGQFLKEQGFDAPNKAIPLKLAVPLLQAASLEDDDYLQDLWAKLLVNSATENSNIDLKSMYIDILEKLTPLDAKILEKIYSLPYEECLHETLLTSRLPDYIEIARKKDERKIEPSEDVKLSLMNLERLNCIFVGKSIGGGQLFYIIHQTLLGKKFVEACTIT